MHRGNLNDGRRKHAIHKNMNQLQIIKFEVKSALNNRTGTI